MFRPSFLCGLLALAAPAQAIDVRFPVQTTVVTDGFANTLEFQVLDLALSKADGDWNLLPSVDVSSNEIEQVQAIRTRQGLDVAWFGMGPQKERQLDAVYFPIAGGLLGWRVFLIDGRRQGEFASIRSLKDLQQLTFGQGVGWGDVEILRAAGLTVVTDEYETLFGSLFDRGFDAFPRGANEALLEQQAHGASLTNLAVEQTLVLRYPYAKFFYVSKDNPALREAIQQGLQRAHQDGSYQDLLLAHPSIQGVMFGADLNGRTVIEIDNPTMTEAARAIPEEYWFRVLQ